MYSLLIVNVLLFYTIGSFTLYRCLTIRSDIKYGIIMKMDKCGLRNNTHIDNNLL